MLTSSMARVLQLFLVLMTAAAAGSATAANDVQRLLQVPTALDVTIMRERVVSWKHSPRVAELHAFAILHLKASKEQQQQQQRVEADRILVCRNLGHQLERWQQHHNNLLQQQVQQQQLLLLLPREELLALLELLEATAAADCSRIALSQLHGHLKFFIEHQVRSPLQAADGEAAESAALWAAAGAAAAAASVAADSNATITAAAQMYFGLHAPTAEPKGKMLLEIADQMEPDSPNYPESAALLLYGARPLLQQPEPMLAGMYKHLKAVLAIPKAPARSRTLALLLKTFFRMTADFPSAFPLSHEYREILLLSIDSLVKETNGQLAGALPLPSFLALHVEALLEAADAGVFTAEILSGQKTLNFCDLLGREMPKQYEVFLHVKQPKGRTQMVPFVRSPVSGCEFSPRYTALKSSNSVDFVLRANGETRIIQPRQANSSASAKPWSPVRSVSISLETPRKTVDQQEVFKKGELYGHSIEAPALIWLKIRLIKHETSQKLAQAAVLATLRVPDSALAAAVPRTTQWPLRLGPQGALLLELKIGDPEMLLPVSGLYDFELLLAHPAPLQTHRQLLFSVQLVFPLPLCQIEVPASPGDIVRKYPILPAQQPLHPLPTIEYTFEPPPNKAPAWLAVLFVGIAAGLSGLGLGVVWFRCVGANLRLLRCNLGNIAFVCSLLFLVSLLLHFFIYRNFFWLLWVLAVCFLPLFLATHRALCSVRTLRKGLEAEERGGSGDEKK